jgi:hypothetical protein
MPPGNGIWEKRRSVYRVLPMRPVSGFDRPMVQWVFVALGVLLVAAAAGEAVGLRRARAEIETLRAANLEERVRQEDLDNRLSREQATREALTLELARVRAGASMPPVQPTLTLTPLTRRGSQPPDATVIQPAASQVIELRLVLPTRSADDGTFVLAIRRWSGGQTVWSRGELPARVVDRHRMVTALVTGDVLAAGPYEITLSRTSGDARPDVASYEVTIAADDGQIKGRR